MLICMAAHSPLLASTNTTVHHLCYDTQDAAEESVVEAALTGKG